MNLKVILILASAIFLIVWVTGFTTENSGNGSSGSSWLDNYVPVHSLGNGTDDFWISYPSSHPQSGQSVSHPQWVLDSLENNCVLLVLHRTGCYWCQAQADRVIELGDKYKNNLTFYDLDLTLGGDIENKGYDAIAYDPDGYPHYIALTVIITSIDNNGSVEYRWHGWEGDMDESDLEGWVKDGIYYYHVNSGE